MLLTKERGANPFKIKELCKERNITMSELASRMGITPVTLSQTLSGNPTLSRLTEIASVLGVEVADLFERSTAEKSLHGCLCMNGEAFVVNSDDEIQKILEMYNNK